MRPKRVDLELLERESIYLPVSERPAGKGGGQAGKAYAAYCASMYRQYGVWIQAFADVALDRNDKPVYFHASSYIPHFNRHGYAVEAVEGCELTEYLRRVPEGSYTLVAVKDEGSQQITEDVAARLRPFGMTKLDKSKLRHSYLWIARKKTGAEYDVLHEECAIEELRWEGVAGEFAAVAVSGGALATNTASIRLNGIERSANHRGLNVVICGPESRVESAAFDTFATLYAQGSLFRANPPKPKAAIFRTISHAGGRIDGVDYTNCEEAFEQSYAQRGHRAFEADIALTSDGELALRHDWEPYLYRHLRQTPPDGHPEGRPLRLEQFAGLRILNRYTPLAIADLFAFLARYPDAHVITDTKHTEPKLVDAQFAKLVEAAAPFGHDVLLRVIPQLYSEEMYEAVEKHFPFPRYAYALYQTKATDDDVVRFVADKKIRYVAIYPERYRKAFGERLKEHGASVFIHTINDLEAVRGYILDGVDGFYTDTLCAADVDRAFLACEVETETRRKMLSDYLVRRFKFPEEEARKSLSSADLGELRGAGERLFQCQSVAEVYAILNEGDVP
ncbi:interleukin-like EMT inducer domain-containing protein [Paenibacillaceae bacterium WGS1546]|uniref:interleukin-like EMT inducer domain-containing protein n=1 Tax=Cohnella sp. WGS1546 TaxID=3366810 RepID=UPI00372D4198